MKIKASGIVILQKSSRVHQNYIPQHFQPVYSKGHKMNFTIVIKTKSEKHVKNYENIKESLPN